MLCGGGGELSYGPCGHFYIISFLHDIKRSVNQDKDKNHSVGYCCCLLPLLFPCGITAAYAYDYGGRRTGGSMKEEEEEGGSMHYVPSTMYYVPYRLTFIIIIYVKFLMICWQLV